MARGVEAKADGEALFVPAEAALPVGTRVTLRGPDGGETAYRVARVQESFTPGMILESLAPPKAKPEPVPEAVPEATEEADGGGGDKKGKRRKRKNTLT